MTLPIPWLTESEALQLCDARPELLDACAAYHTRNGTRPDSTPLRVRATPSGVEVEEDVSHVIRESGAEAALVQAAPPAPGSYPRELVGGLILALQATAPDHPALQAVESAALYAGLLQAARAGRDALPMGEARARLTAALTPFEAP